jgi:hypothetical protein
VTVAGTSHAPSPHPLPLAATLGALGVVYGDIGTSPLYALKEAARAAAHGSVITPAAVYGVVSLILWALVLIISIKYALLILRADNRGEGGIVALLALLHARNARPGTWRARLLIVGLVGAALLYGDGAITPAISVLSAIEGLKVDAPSLDHRRHSGGAVCDAEARHGLHRPDLRPGDARLVHRSRCARNSRHRQASCGAGRGEPALCRQFPDP